MANNLLLLLFRLILGSFLCLHNQGGVDATTKKEKLSGPYATSSSSSSSSSNGHHDQIWSFKLVDGFKKEYINCRRGCFDADDCDDDDDDVKRTLFHIVTVDCYGAIGDGLTDDTKAFQEAWKDACALDSALLMIPKGKTYFVRPLNFKGPCRNNLVVQFAGTLIAPSDPKEWNVSASNAWIYFNNLNNLTVEGWGKLDGQGQQWWEQSCKRDRTSLCVDAPTALRFDAVHNLRVQNLEIVNSPQIHMKFSECNGVQVMNMQVNAPEDSPNTDGIHISKTQNVLIQDTQIGCGDDCVSIVNDSSHIRMHKIICGPGHGISIGSLGRNGREEHVSCVFVDEAILTNTRYGLRIKTWIGGKGSVTYVRFQNVQMYNVLHPILINQNYYDSSACYSNEETAVEVSCVCYQNISGTSATEEAIKLACDNIAPCKNLEFENVELLHVNKKRINSFCENAQAFTRGIVIPSIDCLELSIETPQVLHSIL